MVKMAHNSLIFFIEGVDDKRFFERVVYPLLKNKYADIRTYGYSQKKTEWVINFIKSINSMKHEYIYIQDFDCASCITRKKENTTNELKIIEKNQIIVVKIEIESWYLAGLNEHSLKKIGIRKKITDTNNLTKENFNNLIPKTMSRLEFMQRILGEYNIDLAKENNNSFKYFIGKFIDIE
ncbi:MAG: hypothetical protein KAT05_17180 [Spirochaetes bacterium]|nr:hypothetical protein [Spirochaetota bacterium]